MPRRHAVRGKKKHTLCVLLGGLKKWKNSLRLFFYFKILFIKFESEKKKVDPANFFLIDLHSTCRFFVRICL